VSSFQGNLETETDLAEFLWRSEALWSARLTPGGEILSASPSLERAAAVSLAGRAFATLVCAPHRPVLERLLREAPGRWVQATVAMLPSPAEAASDRNIHLRRTDDEVFVIAEPADRRRDDLVDQLLGLNEDLIAVQRQLQLRQRDLELARDEAEHAVTRLRTLERITLAGVGDEDPDAVMITLLERARELVNGQRSSLLLLDQDRTHLTMSYRLGPDAATFDGWRQRLGDGVAGRAAASGAAMIIEDVSSERGINDQISFVDRSMVVVPLRIDGEVIGVLHVGADELAAFTEEHVVLLAAIGDRAATMLAHTRTVRREHQIAETLQRSFLPHSLPTGHFDLVAHYRAQSDGAAVGGDWYDAIAFSDGRVGLVIGDVAGKGLLAAVSMGQARNALRALALDIRDPAEVIRRLDGFVVDLETMITVIYAVLDPADGSLVYARAGHPPALLRSADGRVEFLEQGLSAPLGVGPLPRREGTAIMPVGSQLVLYTDGLIERRREDLRLSLDKLAVRCADASVRPPDLGAHLLSSSVGPDEQYGDDVAILTAYRRP
jgi:sigma-B regulation protein RsbU (phosphoserine phosphatase)